MDGWDPVVGVGRVGLVDGPKRLDPTDTADTTGTDSRCLQTRAGIRTGCQCSAGALCCGGLGLNSG